MPLSCQRPIVMRGNQTAGNRLMTCKPTTNIARHHFGKILPICLVHVVSVCVVTLGIRYTFFVFAQDLGKLNLVRCLLVGCGGAKGHVVTHNCPFFNQKSQFISPGSIRRRHCSDKALR